MQGSRLLAVAKEVVGGLGLDCRIELLPGISIWDLDTPHRLLVLGSFPTALQNVLHLVVSLLLYRRRCFVLGDVSGLKSSIHDAEVIGEAQVRYESRTID